MNVEFDKLRRKKIEERKEEHESEMPEFLPRINHMRDEFEELKEALASLDYEKIGEELADIANCAEYAFIALERAKYEKKYKA